MKQSEQLLPLVGFDKTPYQLPDVDVMWPFLIQAPPWIVDNPASVDWTVDFTFDDPIAWPVERRATISLGFPDSIHLPVGLAISNQVDRLLHLLGSDRIGHRIPGHGRERDQRKQHNRQRRRHDLRGPTHRALLFSLERIDAAESEDSTLHGILGDVRNVSVAERRARLMRRHGLIDPLGGPGETADAIVALHSSDPATVYLSMRARVQDFEVSDLEDALYEDKSLVRILGMRRTMWVVPTGFAPSVHSSSTRALAAPQRRRLVKMLETGGVSDDGDSWLESVSRKTVEALDRLGEATARELSEEVPELTSKIRAYKKDGSLIGEFGTSTRVLFQLATEGLVIRGRPLGTWLSSQYRWSTTINWLGEPLEPVDRDSAQDTVLTKWLKTFGPGTELDLKWWTGWPVTQVRKGLDRIEAIEVDLESGTGFIAADDADVIHEPPPGTVALLPSLDPTTMGWKEREWYLGDHGDRLFDRNGNAGPTIWLDGRIVGGWTQREDGEIVGEVFDDVSAGATQSIESELASLQEWLGDMNVTARFRSPHDKDLDQA